MAKPNTTAPIRVIEETPAYWRVVFDYPPFNIADADVFQALQDLLVRMDTTEALRVVVFESAIRDFYLAHFDLTGEIANIMTAWPVGPTYSAGYFRAPYEIGGCQPRKNPRLRASGEQRVRPRLRHALRFAREHETRPPRTRGRRPSRRRRYRAPPPSLEIVLSANDFDGDTAERYGYVNRALPDTELDGFIDALARRIASFDRRAVAAAKNLVNQVSLPRTDRLLDAFTSFGAALTWPEAQHRIGGVLERGLQRDANFEKTWPDILGEAGKRASPR